MSKDRYIWLDGVKVSVTEEVYRTKIRAEWREAKQNEVRKQRESSLDFMCEHDFDGQACGNQPSVDEIVAEKLLLDELYAALDELTDDERSLIDALFFDEKSERTVASERGVKRNTVVYHRNKILGKLKNILGK